MNLICLAQVRLKMVDGCEDSTEPSAAIVGKEFYEHLKKDSAVKESTVIFTP